MRSLFFFLAVSVALGAPLSRAQDTAQAPAPEPSPSSVPKDIPTYSLDPVVTEAAPFEALKFDPVVPSLYSTSSKRASNGGLAKDVGNTLPFHLSDNMKPGNVVNLTGNVKTAEEIDVNVLGIPLNAPHGGGYNLTTFPQYMWSGYNFQVGPSLGAFDPRGVAGSLSLRLWSQDALNDADSKMQVTAFQSSTHIKQLSVGTDFENKYAFQMGQSFGLVEGPGGSYAARVFEDGNWKVKFHLLASDQTTKEFQSERTTTATAKYRTARAIPVIQVDRKFSEASLLKTSVFFDKTYIKVDDPSSRVLPQERTHTEQTGIESTYLDGPWRIGFGGRYSTFKKLTFRSPDETIGNFQATYGHRRGSLLIEPTIGATSVTRIGTRPMATIGVRNESGEDREFGQFIRVGYHNRFPSLLDRYQTYTVSGQLATVQNPELKEEKVYSIEAGLDWRSDSVSASLTGFGRYAKDARFYRDIVYTGTFGAPGFVVVTPGTILNNGDGYQFGAISSISYDPTSFITISNRTAFTKARYKTAGRPYLYLPEWVSVFGLDLHDPKQRYGVEATQKVASKYFGGSETVSGPPLPGYGYLDLAARAALMNTLTLSVGVDNVFDREIQFRQFQPSVGRIYTVSIVGIF